MRFKATLFVLLFVVGVNALTLQQIYRVPTLVSHFLEHKQRDPNVSFIQFLGAHYWNDHGDDGDQDRDMQLPFKKPFFSHASPLLFFQLEQPQLLPVRKGIEFPVFRHTDKFFNNYLDSLFRPPQRACC